MSEPTLEQRLEAIEGSLGLVWQALDGAAEQAKPVAVLRAQSAALMERLRKRGQE